MRFDRRYRKIVLSEDQGVLLPEENTLVHDDISYELRPMNDDFKVSKGGNSSVFVLHDIAGESEDQIIKISNYHKIGKISSDAIKRRYGRFMSEIQVLYEIKQHEVSENIISIIDDGVVEISGLEFPYYIMEKADSDLKKYLIDDKNDLDFQEKVKLCRDIFKGIRAIHSLDYYHRDIKPDNIFLFFKRSSGLGEGASFSWKIGDLGLARHRDKDYDDIGEKIGPLGWLSPEAMNKYLTEKAGIGLDCTIDQASDIFQLGKLFWFVFKLNVPIGQIRIGDFKDDMPHEGFLFDLILEMLQYSKERRCSKVKLEEYIELLSSEVGV
jgi:serine/threonine protein kinase